jgi:hypothetical protein
MIRAIASLAGSGVLITLVIMLFFPAHHTPNPDPWADENIATLCYGHIRMMGEALHDDVTFPDTAPTVTTGPRGRTVVGVVAMSTFTAGVYVATRLTYVCRVIADQDAAPEIDNVDYQKDTTL